MRTSARFTARGGFTLIELLVVIAIIAILAGMLIPAVGMVQENAKYQRSGKNMNGIVVALIKYSDEEGGWPQATGAGPDYQMVNTNTNHYLATVGAFYVLKYTYPADIDNKLFEAPGEGVPQGKPRDDYSTSIEDWGWLNKGNRVAYAFDWSAPKTAASNRIWVGERDPRIISPTKCMVVYGDGRSAKLDVNLGRTAQGTNKTVSNTGSGSATHDKVALNVSSGDTDDNIWDDYNDDMDYNENPGVWDPMAESGGSEIRCFLK